MCNKKNISSLPEETHVYFQKNAASIELVVWYFLVIVGIYMMITGKVLLGIFCSFFFFIAGVMPILKKRNNKNPQIILNKSGIKTEKFSLKNWKEIQDIKVYYRIHRSTKFWAANNFWLSYIFFDENGKKQTIKIELDDLSIDPERLEDLIFFYKSKYDRTK